MKCPECGFDAGEAKFCPECGNDLVRPEPDEAGAETGGLCPECGAETGDAKFCPECGHRLSDAPPAPPARGKRQGSPRAPRAQAAPAAESASGKSRQDRRRAERQAAHREASRAAAPARAAGGGPKSSTWLIWGGFAAAAVVIVILVVALSNGSGGGGTSTQTTAAVTPVATVPADTSGSYAELVARANDLYDQGGAAFSNNDGASGQKYFAAAAKVYAAAWKKQADDPNVGTDYATALFYSGDTENALTQVDVVIKKNPEFQTAHLNKGIFLQTASQDAKDAGDTATADELLADARASFEKTISLGADTEQGKNAATQLEQL